MPVYTNYGGNVRAKLLRKRTWWLVFGRCRYGSDSIDLDHPWPTESIPEPEDPTVNDPDLDQAPTTPIWKKLDTSGILMNDPSGTINIDGNSWSIQNGNSASNILYLKFILDKGEVEELTGYRRLTLRVDPTLYPGISSTTTLGENNTFYDIGSTFYSSNEILIERSSNEIHVVEFILPQ